MQLRFFKVKTLLNNAFNLSYCILHPKQGGRAEYHSVVYITTEPQSAFRGSGPTIEAAHDVAAITALRALAGLSDADGSKKAAGQ